MIAIHKMIASVLGVGYLRPASGTWGTAAAVVFVYLSSVYLQYSLYQNMVSILGLIVVGTFSINKVLEIWGKDPKNVVIDEFVGYLITIAFVPFTLKNLIIAFFIFRFLDILKPLGIRYFDNIDNAFGVMFDDVVAGLYGMIIMLIIHYFA